MLNSASHPRTAWRSASNEDFPRHDDLVNHVAQLVGDVELTSFSSQPPWCLYEGVSCGDVAGISSYAMIRSISLKNLGLTGTLPDSIGDFCSLKLFDISSNHIHGNIPDTLINWLSGISAISMNDNNLTGTIPSSIGKLVSLTAVHLHDNDLEGSIPSAIGSLNMLSILTLERNSLTGTIPSTLGDLAALQYISLHSNMLQGTIPSGMSELSRLIFFDTANNYLLMGSARASSDIAFSDVTRNGTSNFLNRRLQLVADPNPSYGLVFLIQVTQLILNEQID